MLELRSLEEPLYLMGQFFKQPLACLNLAGYLTANTGEHMAGGSLGVRVVVGHPQLFAPASWPHA